MNQENGAVGNEARNLKITNILFIILINLKC